MMKKKWIPLCMLLMGFVFPVSAAPITHVQVTVKTAQYTLPSIVQARIGASIQTVGNHVLLNQDSQTIKAQQAAYVRTLKDIVNRVLIGYTVDDISLKPGTDTQLMVRIRPWNDTVQKVTLSMDYGAVTPLGKTYIQEDIQSIEGVVDNLLLGLPIESLDWAQFTVKEVLEKKIADMLPEFYAHITIKPGKTSAVTIFFIPKLPVVRQVEANVESEHVPQLLFLQAQRNVANKYAGLEGLPIDFVKRHSMAIQEQIYKDMSEQGVIRRYKINVTPKLFVGEKTQIYLQAKTRIYDIRGLVYMDIGRTQNQYIGETVLQAHLGRKIGTQHEVFTDVQLRPGNFTWNMRFGYFCQAKRVQLGIRYETADETVHVFGNVDWQKRWQWRWDRNMTMKRNEWGFRHRMRNYLGIEYVVSSTDHWIRLLGYM